MFLIRTRVGPSQIHGNGVFACERVLPGTTVWQYEPAFDRTISEGDLLKASPAFREYIDMYAYHSSDLGGQLVLSCDNARFLNHSTEPNTHELPFKSVASRTINVGDEITCNYGAFCANWPGFEV